MIKKNTIHEDDSRGENISESGGDPSGDMEDPIQEDAIDKNGKLLIDCGPKEILTVADEINEATNCGSGGFYRDVLLNGKVIINVRRSVGGCTADFAIPVFAEGIVSDKPEASPQIIASYNTKTKAANAEAKKNLNEALAASSCKFELGDYKKLVADAQKEADAVPDNTDEFADGGVSGVLQESMMISRLKCLGKITTASNDNDDAWYSEFSKIFVAATFSTLRQAAQRAESAESARLGFIEYCQGYENSAKWVGDNHIKWKTAIDKSIAEGKWANKYKESLLVEVDDTNWGIEKEEIAQYSSKAYWEAEQKTCADKFLGKPAGN